MHAICACAHALILFQSTATTEIYTYCHTLSLPSALPIYLGRKFRAGNLRTKNIALRAQNIAGKPAHETTSSKRRAANDGQKATGNKPTRPAPDFARPGRQKRTVGFQTVCAH